jgi:hypothetical protein
VKSTDNSGIKGDISESKINEFATKSKNKNIRDQYREVN